MAGRRSPRSFEERRVIRDGIKGKSYVSTVDYPDTSYNFWRWRWLLRIRPGRIGHRRYSSDNPHYPSRYGATLVLAANAGHLHTREANLKMHRRPPVCLYMPRDSPLARNRQEDVTVNGRIARIAGHRRRSSPASASCSRFSVAATASAFEHRLRRAIRSCA